MHAPPARAGHLVWRVTGLTGGLPSVVGTHAEFSARGQFVRLRLVLEVDDATFHTVSTADARVIDQRGVAYPPSREATLAKRQPLEITLGAHDVLAFDLWADLPSDARAAGVALPGDDGPPAQVPLPAAHPAGAPG